MPCRAADRPSAACAPSRHRRRPLARAVALAATTALTVATAACGGGDATAPMPRLDGAAIDRAVAETGEILGQPLLWAVASLPLDGVRPMGASLRAAGGTAPAPSAVRTLGTPPSPGAALREGLSAVVRLAAARPATAALPPALVGRVYDFHPASGSLSLATHQGGAPPNGMRVRILDGGAQMLGFADLRDQSTDTQSILTIAVVDVAQRVAIYSGSMRSTTSGTATSATIQARVINPLVPGKEVRVAITQQTTGTDGPTPRTSVTVAATAPSLQAELGMAMPLQAGDRVRLTARVADRAIVFESTAERQPDGSYEPGATARITVDGAAYGSVSDDAQGASVFHDPRGRTMSDAEREPVERLRGGLEQLVSVALVPLVLSLLPALLME